MDWWNIFAWGYATDIEECEEEEEITINVTIETGD